MSENLEESVRKQVEYYFSDENLIRGKFLKNKIFQSEGGWIHLNILVTFKRLASLTKNVKQIGKILFKSQSNTIELSKDRQKVRRIGNKPPPVKNSVNKSDLVSRSAYVEGFSTNLEIGDLIVFFQQFAACHIIIRKYFDKKTKTYKSKGSAFITFATRVQCEKFLKNTIVMDGIVLTIMHQESFIENQRAKKSENKRE